MARGYRVRLDDGSEVGPMDEQAVRDWCTQGLISRDSPVLKPGAKEWVPLFKALDLAKKSAPAPQRSTTSAPRPAAPRLPSPPAARPALPPAAAGPALSPGLVKAAAVVVGLGALGIGGYLAVDRLGLFATDPREREIREWASSDRRFTDEALGISLDLPGGWIPLRLGQPLVAAPPEARLAFAHPRRLAFGYIVTETSPRGISSLEDFLGRIVAERRAAIPGLEVGVTGPLSVGKVTGLSAAGTWGADGARFRELAAAWKDGWTYFALVAWGPERVPSADLEAVLAGFSSQNPLGPQLREAVAAAARDVPHLSAEGAELVMAQSEARILEPPEVFRRSYKLVRTGLAALPPAEVKELGQLTSAAYASLPRSERLRLASYFDAVAADRLVPPAQDAEMCRVMRSAVSRLSAARLARMRTLYEKALRAGVASD